mmetsp:Transcript_35523/g.118780  ORF Transcript_35523/g.118780 Transcript_35523/m.118780 type:complete len:577 (+) Transcript_35523:572-2302(+)
MEAMEAKRVEGAAPSAAWKGRLLAGAAAARQAAVRVVAMMAAAAVAVAAGGAMALDAPGAVAAAAAAAGGVVGGVVGGVSSLGELATTAASWSLDAAHAWSHALAAGGRRDVLEGGSNGDALALRVLPPPPPHSHAEACTACVRAASQLPLDEAAAAAEGGRFGISRRRHHCRHCGGAFCAAHLKWRAPLQHKFSGVGPAGQRVCEGCARQIAREEHENRLASRLVRCVEFGAGSLRSYVEVLDDTVASKARRAGELTLAAARRLPLSAKLHATVVGLDNARKYGRLGLAGVLLREDLLRMLITLRAVGGEAIARKPVHELTGALYYLMARRREERGAFPTFEEAAHAGCAVPTDAEVADLGEWAPLALRVAYETTLVDMQRHARLHGYELLFAELQGATHARGAHRPAFSFLACRTRRRAVLVVRGTQDLSDIVTDSRAHATRFCGGWAHAGMARTARWLQRELGPCLLHLSEVCGCEVVLAGHSLGAGVAALLAALLLPRLPALRCVGFATPSCAAGEGLLAPLRACSISLVHRNDAVPRATLQSASTFFFDAALSAEPHRRLSSPCLSCLSCR